MKSKPEHPGSSGGAQTQEPIAIVAAGGVFPGSEDLSGFWRVLREGVDTSRDVPQGRWVLPTDRVLQPGQSGVQDRVYTQRACFLNPFKTQATGLALEPATLDALDGSVHVALEAARRVLGPLDWSGIDKRRVGVILGNIALPTDASSELAVRVVESLQRGGTPSIVPWNRYVSGLPAGLVAEAFGLGGGSFTIDAACASSLYALKLACDELISGRADAMLAGGMSRPESLYTQMGFSQLRALSVSGRCSPFDAAGDGLIVGEGAGMVLLCRLSDALEQNRPILGVIRGIGLSNDLEGNLLSPNSEGQLRALKQAYRAAGWSPDQVDFIECHATGTPVGDAVEFESLCRLWEGFAWNPGQCVLGAVKANIGHLLTGAGAASLVKVLLALQHEELPPTANFNAPSPKIPLQTSPFQVLRQPRSWRRRSDGTPRRAAINGFGFGGINAHVLIEEWIESTAPRPKKVARLNLPRPSAPKIAIVGLAAVAGPWASPDRFRERVLGGRSEDGPALRTDWRGFALPVSVGGKPGAHGYYLEDLRVPVNRYRIPPRELAELLPQQAWMLETARLALEDARLAPGDPARTGVFVGLSLDLRTTDFHIRWETLAPSTPGSAVSEVLGSPLTADRTMGALAGVNASRIAKEFQFGGPSYTVCNEEASGMKALEIAVRALQRGEVDRAIAGAVDLPGDWRTQLATAQLRPASPSGVARPFDTRADGALPGEGACALVLKRLEDAERDGDRVYAVVRGMGSAHGSTHLSSAQEEAWLQAFERAYADAGDTPASVGFIEADACGASQLDGAEARALSRFFLSDAQTPCHMGSVKADIGHTGAASGLLAIARASLALYHELIPPVRNLRSVRPELQGRAAPRLRFPTQPLHWVRNRADGPRRAGVSASSLDGNCAHAVLQEWTGESVGRRQTERSWSLNSQGEQLFVLQGDTREELTEQVVLLRELIDSKGDLAFPTLARRWFERGSAAGRQRRLAILAQDAAQLRRLLHTALDATLRDPASTGLAPAPKAQDRERIFYGTPSGLGHGDIAFVYPGAGSYFVGMGRDLAIRWPQVLRQQDQENLTLASQMHAHQVWNPEDSTPLGADHRAVICGQVTLGAMTTDLLRSFGVEPDAAIGYSLGESTALFALRAWKDRDEMFRRVSASSLFTRDLTGTPEVLREVWNLPENQPAAWQAGVVDRSASQVKTAIGARERVYILIINTPSECVIGGDAAEVREVVESLGCHWFPLEGVSTVHCPLLKPFESRYRNLHLFETEAPAGVRFYSGGWGHDFVPDKDSAADAIVAQASGTIDFPRAVRAAHASGVRVFIEMGPGQSCTRMIGRILANEPHLVRSLCPSAQDSVLNVLRLLAQLIVEGVDVDVRSLYPRQEESANGINPPAGNVPQVSIPSTGPVLAPVKPQTKAPPATPSPSAAAAPTQPVVIAKPTPTKSQPTLTPAPVSPPAEEKMLVSVPSFSSPSPEPLDPMTAAPSGDAFETELLQAMDAAQRASANAHAAFLRFSQGTIDSIGRVVLQELEQPEATSALAVEPFTAEAAAAPAVEEPQAMELGPRPALDRAQCLEFARGAVGRVLGQAFERIDRFPTRVRLPDEPLMLVDRILEIDAEPLSMSHGRVVTEHDIHPGAWYLDCGCIPTCIAVEAGQADLFLSGYLGIDLQTEGKSVYRLLDARVCFHQGLPGPGSVIHYDIHIDHFFRQGGTWLFRFRFEATVNGQPLLSMKDGCAGFFSEAELAGGKGIVRTAIDLRPVPGKQLGEPIAWTPLEGVEAYSEAQLEALRGGDFNACFGPAFSGLDLKQPVTLPRDRMRLVHRITHLDPVGGRFGIGLVRGEADIHPTDWFLTCHFVDDRVMPGTLMFECCLHTLRVYLLRLGWLVENDGVALEPVPGVASQLKCRGQVLETTRTVTYEVAIKEIGYGPEPYVIADALMYADGKPIVEIGSMSLRYRGASRETFARLWQGRAAQPAGAKHALYGFERILAFAIGKPSVAFGAPYEIFDEKRRIARLPGPPYQFLDRITEVQGEPFKMVAGGVAVAEYDVPPAEWYFQANRQGDMPFAVLLEIALQPCGWLAAYVGSALTSDEDLSFRNLGGSGVQHVPVLPDAGVLVTRVKMTRASSSAGMIIQWFDLDVRCGDQPVYTGDTYFGFFPAAALAKQEGIQGAKPYQPTPAEVAATPPQPYPAEPPYPDRMLAMIDLIEVFAPVGGPHGLGFLRGTKRVVAEEWFFKAHFYQDPVVPGSLGLESFLQLLKFAAIQRWGHPPGARWEAVATGVKHEWVYRGQIIPRDREVTVEVVVTAADDALQRLTAEGFLSVDGRIIYGLKQFTVQKQLLETQPSLR